VFAWFTASQGPAGTGVEVIGRQSGGTLERDDFFTNRTRLVRHLLNQPSPYALAAIIWHNDDVVKSGLCIAAMVVLDERDEVSAVSSDEEFATLDGARQCRAYDKA